MAQFLLITTLFTIAGRIATMVGRLCTIRSSAGGTSGWRSETALASLRIKPAWQLLADVGKRGQSSVAKQKREAYDGLS